MTRTVSKAADKAAPQSTAKSASKTDKVNKANKVTKQVDSKAANKATNKPATKVKEKAASKTAAAPAARQSKYIVRNSKIHGRGVFAARDIAAGTRIMEYRGEIITEKEANRRESLKAADNFHTFFFSLEDGKIIDGGSGGNNARWINHSCEPNCEAQEDEDGRVFIYALRDLKEGEELYYDYGLIIDVRYTPALKRAYACLCGTKTCRGTLLAPKRKKKV